MVPVSDEECMMSTKASIQRVVIKYKEEISKILRSGCSLAHLEYVHFSKIGICSQTTLQLSGMFDPLMDIAYTDVFKSMQILH